jgi:hypothetical protein
VEGENMAENYKYLYEQMKKIVAMYQDEIVPGMRKQIDELESSRDVTDTNVGKWISVKERLPENDYGKHWKERKHYLVSLAPSGLMCVAHYGYKEYGWWIDGHDCVLSATNFKEVTHWMEINNLPQPPKGE